MRGSRYSPSRRLHSSKRYTGVPSWCFRAELPHRGQELLGQVLEDQAVRLQGDDVARRDLAQVVADLRDGHVLLSHDVVVEGPQRVVAEELRRVDVVPVHLAGGVREGLAPLAALPVQLVVAGAHGVDQVLVPGPQPDEGVDRELAPRAPWRPGTT